MSDDTVEIPKPEMVAVKDVELDDTNPNFLPDHKLAALKENIRRYGFVVPVITNKDLLVADGEHRTIAARELGMEKIPVVRLDVDDVDRRILRQVMNKLRGEHDYLMDSDDFLLIDEAGRADDLKKLLAIEQKDYEAVMKLQADEDELYKEIMSRSDAKEKDLRRYTFTVKVEDEQAVNDALEATGYKDQNKQFVTMVHEYAELRSEKDEE